MRAVHIVSVAIGIVMIGWASAAQTTPENRPAQRAEKQPPPERRTEAPGAKDRAAADGDAPAYSPIIEEKADAALKKMGEFLARQKQFHFEAEIVRDDVVGDQKIQYSNTASFDVARPDRIQSTFDGDRSVRRAWYNGKQLAVVQPDRKVYFQIDVPPNIDEMLDHMDETYDMSTPTADFLRSNVYAELKENARTGRYLGVHHVGQRKCHHLAFTQDTIDWQLWIDDADPPLPRKLVITYKLEDLAPQYSITFTQWNVSPKFDEQAFVFPQPADMQKIEPVRMRSGDTAQSSSAEKK